MSTGMVAVLKEPKMDFSWSRGALSQGTQPWESATTEKGTGSHLV